MKPIFPVGINQRERIMRLLDYDWKARTCLLALIFVIGCDQYKEAPKPLPPTPAISAPPATIDPLLIELVEGNMRRSTAFRIDGDLRPVWTVSGRIRNHSSSELKSVSLKIQIQAKSTADVVDENVLVVDTEIPPGSISSFSRDIQIMPPDIPWAWNYHAVKAIAK